MQEATQEQMNKIKNNMAKSASEMNSIMHDTMSASMQSTSVLVKGWSDMFDNMSNLMKRTLEQSSIVSQTMFESSSMDEMMNKQGDIIKCNFESMMSEVSNISQLSSRIAQEAAEPMKTHVNQTMSKMSQCSNNNKTQAA